MGKIIAICNQKGGVGKTTTTISMGRVLVDEGYKVLLVDVDDSGNPSLSKWLGFDSSETSKADAEKNLTDLMMLKLMGREIAEDVRKVIKHNKEGMDVIAADSALAGITNYINVMNDSSKEDSARKRGLLREVLSCFKDDYDYILLDAAPSLNIMSVNLLTAADEPIIVSQAQGTSAEAVTQLLLTVAQIKEGDNPDLILKGLLITMVDNRTNYSKDKAADMTEIYSELGLKVFNTKIPRAVVAESCVEARESVIAYAPDSKPTNAYREFVKEYLNS